ncbi:hypothetical protein I3843_04G185700 [Carya illinoinensis]|uniref:Transmembrane protein n=1 Tax=Carya illinoinensis TaxID=32201 RepID=A0A8T1QYD9_CARIL|nr:uncharacterized protein LOC122307737 [Carya illinoinensis]KAG2713856.1 hypothetical protein I3760_04G195400 [Carya illinoinensis]KAG6658951.1 hypothetical protein CIPAW_04G197000 [Carya illinoinensis]KAG6719298.1 hypothetical protein I3842_04G195100 [Carya illinoinensis]KAG6719299.1 hypothetical protein I3842_04G195100 [Carya illinoinensis]KAG7984936.1 hypothetical protein I3843_04G185700 [Carya illinoinensis]
MNLVNTVKDQMASALCCFRNPLPWFAVLAPLIFLISAGFSGLGFSSLFQLSSTVFILSAIYFTFSKRKPVVAENREEDIGSEQESSSQMEDHVPEAQPESKTKTQKDKSEEGMSEIHDRLVTSPYNSRSESEWQYKYYLSTSEESEVEWPFRDQKLDQSPDCSDGSISDEESLIEIALPSGQYVGHNEVIKTKDNKQQKVPDHLSQESIFQPRCLMELLSEMNEEDNLIEIDISMGSIKCSRFEIEA